MFSDWLYHFHCFSKKKKKRGEADTQEQMKRAGGAGQNRDRFARKTRVAFLYREAKKKVALRERDEGRKA